MKKVKKAVILAAGLGTRMQPMTNAIPKPMLPVVDKPIIDYIVEEAISSGIEEIVIIVNFQKHVLKKHFEGRNNIYFITQPDVGGTAIALNKARIFTQDEPFALYYADEIVHGIIPCTKQLMDAFYEFNADMITAIEVENSDMISQYNSLIIEPTSHTKTFKIKEIIEKPVNPLSRFTSIGRFIVSPRIYNEIEHMMLMRKETSSEFYLTAVFSSMTKEGNIYGYLHEGKRYDVGNKSGWLNANIELSINDNILKVKQN